MKMCSGLISTETNQKTSKTTGLERDTLNEAYPPGMPMHMLCIDFPSVSLPILQMLLDLLWTPWPENIVLIGGTVALDM